MLKTNEREKREKKKSYDSNEVCFYWWETVEIEKAELYPQQQKLNKS